MKVHASYFDDNSVDESLRFSASVEGAFVYGYITSATILSYFVRFDDDTSPVSIPKVHVQPTLRSTSNVRVTGNKNDEIDDDDDVQKDPDWNDEEIDEDGSSAENVHLYLMQNKKKIFLGRLIPTEPGAIVHHKLLNESERKFEIINVLDSAHWDSFDPDLHSIGSFITWDINNTKLKVEVREPVDGLEMVIPSETLSLYQIHFEEGCHCESECRFINDKIYHEWITLRKTDAKKSPEKTLKRKKVNQIEARKKLKLKGEPYVTSSGKLKAGKKEMEWIQCKCKNKCSVNVGKEEREQINQNFWDIPDMNKRRQYIVGNMEAVLPAQRTTKENSRRSKTLLYYLEKADDTRIQVCSKVFPATLQVTQKFMYSWEHSDHGFSKPEGRGRSTVPKHKLTDEDTNEVLKHLDSFVKVPAHYVRKDSKKIYIEDNTNFSKLSIPPMHRLYEQECIKNEKKPVGVETYRKIFKSLNYKIHKPKKDQCKICVKFTRSTEEQKIAAKESYDMHVSNNKKVMGLKAMYKNKGKECKNLLVFNFDLEAVLYTPCDKVSTIF